MHLNLRVNGHTISCVQASGRRGRSDAYSTPTEPKMPGTRRLAEDELVEDIAADLWFRELERGGILLEDARHLVNGITMTLLWFEDKGCAANARSPRRGRRNRPAGARQDSILARKKAAPVVCRICERFNFAPAVASAMLLVCSVARCQR